MYPPDKLDADTTPGVESVENVAMVTGLSLMNIFGLEGDNTIVTDEEPIHTTPEDEMVVPTPPMSTLLTCDDVVPTVPDAHIDTHPPPPIVTVLDDPPTFTEPSEVIDTVLVTLPALM